jgi:uncharacterized delta-60 repeat protein
MKQIVILPIFCLLYNLVHTQNEAGIIDSTFGNNGKIVTFSEIGFLNSNAAASQNDGSIIDAGGISFTGQPGGFFASKYSKDGLLDSNFGDQGIATIIGTGIGQAIAVQQDNKIVITGYTYDLFGPYYITIARLNSNGSIDSSFGSNGFIKTLAGDQGQGIAIQPDGKILIVGVHTGNAITLRYLPDGSPDKSFGNNGVVETKFGNNTSSGNTILIQPDDKIVIAGRTDKTILLGRYNNDGTLDETFGNSGKVLYDIGSGVDEINDIVLQPDGKIIAVGTTFSKFSDTSNAIILRYTSDGKLDESFGNNGLIIFQLQTNTRLISVALQKDGRIITAGGVDDANGIHQHFLVERFGTNGIIDSSFGNDGYQITEIDESDLAKKVTLQQDGKIVLAGSAFNDSILGPSEDRIALCRYNNDINKKQIFITKIKRWIQHHNGIEWNNMPGIQSYAVQRSVDVQHWTTINRQSVGSGQQFAVNHYSDPTPPSTGTTYYRLQTTSTSNAVANSNVIAITNDELNVSLSPNPAKSALSISDLPSSEKVKITVIDFDGNVKLQTTTNNSTCSLNIASLSSGNYVLKIETSTNSVSKQFVKE